MFLNFGPSRLGVDLRLPCVLSVELWNSAGGPLVSAGDLSTGKGIVGIFEQLTHFLLNLFKEGAH